MNCLKGKRFLYLGFISLLILLYPHGHAPQAGSLAEFEEGFTRVVQKVSPVVVNISAEGTVNQTPFPFGGGFEGTPFEEFFRQFGPSIRQHFTSLGSGFIVRESGYILTNNHVIQNASNISVILSDGSTFRNAKIIGTDPRVDIALLKINPPHPLPQGKLGDSDKIEVGSWAIAIGNPYGLNSTVTTGVISAKGRNLPMESESVSHNLIQTDASINPGNSGGPLVNIRGEIIGINTSIASPSGGSVGIGFAIPVNTIKAELQELIRTGKVVHGWLGIYMQTMDPELLKEFHVESGVLIADVAPHSPAAKAGLKPGDVIVKFNEKTVNSPNELQDFVSQQSVGTQIMLTIVRNKQERLIPITLEALPEQGQIQKNSPTFFGLHLKEITPALAKNYQLAEHTGLLVVQVDPDSIAAMAAISPRDVLLEVNHKPIRTLRELKQLLEENHTSVLLLLEHQSLRRYLVLKTGL